MQIAGMRLKQPHIRTPDKVAMHCRVGKCGQQAFKVESGANVIDKIHHRVIKGRTGKGARLASLVPRERQRVGTGNGAAQPAAEAQAVSDDSFKTIKRCH